MGRISFTDIPAASCNKDVFTRLTSATSRFRFLCKAVTPRDTLRLKSLTYLSFLKTLYWYIIREYVIETRDGKCQYCGSKDRLEVHHKSYTYQAEEHRALDTLALVCSVCHENKLHQKEAKNATEALQSTMKKLGDSFSFKMPRPKVNPNYDPRMMMNIRQYGDIRGYQGGRFESDSDCRMGDDVRESPDAGAEKNGLGCNPEQAGR